MGGMRPLPIPSSSDLAKRLTLALDRLAVLRGEPLTFPQVHEFLAARDISLSRARWSYMLGGEAWRVRDRQLLTALADLLEVPEEYLYTGVMSDDMRAELGLVTAMRAAKVQHFAARTLGDLAPHTLDAIAAALRELDAEEDDPHDS